MQQFPRKPPLQGEVPPQAAEGCGAWPYQYPFGPPLSCVGADDFIGPPAGLVGSGRSSAAARSRPQCRAGDFARRLGHCGIARFPGRCKLVPYECKARCCQTLRGIPAVNRQCPPQSAPCGASSSPLQGSLSKRQPPAKQAKQIQPGTRRFRAVLFCTETPVRGSLFGNH